MSVPRSLSLLVALTTGFSLLAQEETRGGGAQARPMPRMESSPGMRITGPTGGRGYRGFEPMEPRRRVVLAPPPLERHRNPMTGAAWQRRDIFKEMQRMARQGFIPVVPVGGQIDSLRDVAYFPAGWKAYGFVVPAKGELEVRLDHPNLGWFRLMMVNKWGGLQEGMLQNLIPKGTPVVTFKNPKNSPQQVFVIADDPGWMSSRQYPYTISVKRSWDGKLESPDAMPQTVGIWAKHGEVVPKADPSRTEAPKPAPEPDAAPAKSR